MNRPQVASKFGKATLAAEVAEGLDLRGRTAIVTGGTAGLGRETARVLAMTGAHVVFTARDAAKGQTLAERTRRLATLKKMHKTWPFFANLLSNMDMVLAKTDIAVASRYAQLVTDKKLRKHVFGRIVAEWERTSSVLSEITGNNERLANNPLLARSIKNRFPYLDPLNHLQVELLKRHRAGDDNVRLGRGIHLTINGIAAGLRNTG